MFAGYQKKEFIKMAVSAVVFLVTSYVFTFALFLLCEKGV